MYIQKKNKQNQMHMTNIIMLVIRNTNYNFSLIKLIDIFSMKIWSVGEHSIK